MMLGVRGLRSGIKATVGKVAATRDIADCTVGGQGSSSLSSPSPGTSEKTKRSSQRRDH